MEYNEIYNLVKPIYEWLNTFYPTDKEIIIDKNAFYLCEKRILALVGSELKDETKSELKDKRPLGWSNSVYRVKEFDDCGR